MKIKCTCPCHSNPDIKHIVACCIGGYREELSFADYVKRMMPAMGLNDTWEDLWNEFKKTKEPGPSGIHRAFLNWLIENYNAPTKK